jgi:hypothetical protein
VSTVPGHQQQQCSMTAALPKLPDPHGPAMPPGPTPWSNWVIPGKHLQAAGGHVGVYVCAGIQQRPLLRNWLLEQQQQQQWASMARDVAAAAIVWLSNHAVTHSSRLASSPRPLTHLFLASCNSTKPSVFENTCVSPPSPCPSHIATPQGV